MGPPPPFDARALALHQERLRAFLVTLLGDEHAAEDVLQETWLQALSRMPKEPRALGAWLRTVARHIASNRRRGSRRRLGREALAARAEALPSSAEIAQRVEVQRRVLAVLEELPDPHRTLLRDRYFGDMTPAQIARRDGESAHTVKDRLRRARAVMRAALARAGWTDDGDLRRALVAAPAWRPRASSVLVSSLAMKKLVIGLVLVAGAAIVWRLAGAGPLSAPEPAARPPAASADELEGAATRVPHEPGSARVAVAESAGAAPAATRGADAWAVRGRVVLADGVVGDLPRVVLRLGLHDGYELGAQPVAAHELASDAAGRFAWLLPDPGRTVSISVEALDDPELCIQVPEQHLAVVGEGPVENIVVRVSRRDAWIEGRVRAAATGAPLEGAHVAYNDATARTDVRGAFQLRVPSAGYGAVIVTAAGYRQLGRAPGGLTPGGTTRVDLELEPELGQEGRLHGTVRAAGGAFLAEAVVRCSAAVEHEVHTDVTGHYELSGVRLDPDAYTPVEARCPGYATSTLHVRQDPADPQPRAGTQLDFVLVRGTRVAGRVVDPGGRPVRGARIWLGADVQFVANRRTYSRDDGSFGFDHVAPGRTRLGATKRGYVEVVTDLDVPATRAEPHVVPVVLDPAVALRGRVVDASGAPVAGALVRARAAEEPGAPSARGSLARSDSSGRFELTDVPAGDLSLAVSGNDLVRRSLDARSDAPDLEIVVERASRLAGRVIDAATRKPIERFVVRLAPPADGELGTWFEGIESAWIFSGRAFSAVDGRWSSDEKDPFGAGTWTAVEVEAEGYEVLRLDPVRVPARGSFEELVHALVAR